MSPATPDTPAVPPLTTELLATFRTNVLRVVDPDDIDETVVEIRPAAVADTPAELPTLHVITAWNPGGAPTSVGRNVAHRESLEYDVLAAGGIFTVGAAHAQNLAWAEETLTVKGLTDAAAARVASAHGQPALLRLDAGRLTVLRTPSCAVVAEVDVTAFRLERALCVMPKAQPSPEEVCVRAGGPWVRRSIEAAAFWTRDRDALLTVLGCDTCGHGRRTGAAPGRPLMLHEWSVASRYGPPRILRELTDEEFDEQ